MSPTPPNNTASYPLHNPLKNQQRLECFCHYHINPNNSSQFATFPCNVRAFTGETFKVWRCPNCQTIHALDAINLDCYYAKYPVSDATLTWPYRIIYRKLHQRLLKHGFSKTHSLLDYGCGANGLFLQYLKQKGFTNCYGYDPYGSPESFGNLTVLQQKPFNYILLQDVIEHIDDPDALLSELNHLLAPGGYILIGTPNAANIDLTRPDISDHYNPIHAPYHLHLYTPKTLESLGSRQGWEAVEFFDRAYYDIPFVLNTRAWNEYQRLLDGTLNVILEPIKIWKALTSYKYLFYAIFGYWLSFKTDMALMFRKSDRSFEKSISL
jgi:SAM-dependent methyltransferase